MTLYSILDAFLKAKKTHTVMVTVDEGDQLVSTAYPRVTRDPLAGEPSVSPILSIK